jgi:hypothetical protein
VIRLGDRRGDPEAADGPAERAASSGQHSSPGLAAIVAPLDPDAKCRVLDLGPAVAANIEFYGTFARHVRVLDAVLELAALVVDDDDEGLIDRRLDGLMRHVDGQFDVVLAWDVVSHVDQVVARGLFTRLQAACSHGSRLFLMTYEGGTMPAAPQVFEIRGEDRLLYRPSSSELVPAATIAPARVERLLGGFRVESSFLLRHGVREYAAIKV